MPCTITKPDDNIPEIPIVGKFYPLFKLPTNGNYVILVFAQVDPDFDGNDKVFALIYDLNGNYLNFANELYSASSEYINNYIDISLGSHYTYVLYYENGEVVFPPRDTCSQRRRPTQSFKLIAKVRLMKFHLPKQRVNSSSL